MKVRGWYIPGMRNLADLSCPGCGRLFYADLPVGHGIYYPTLVDCETGEVYGSQSAPWFRSWLQDSYRNRTSTPVEFSVEQHRPIKRAVLLNCLDKLYGHCLLKLLNAQYYLDRVKDLDLMVMVPESMKWLVPDGVAATWLVRWPLKSGTQWNDWLAREIHERIRSLDECWLSVAFSHPHPEDFSVERFLKTIPFRNRRMNNSDGKVKVTFIWRHDRLWCSKLVRGVANREARLRVPNRFRFLTKLALWQQSRRIKSLVSELQKEFHNLDFAVVGLGDAEGFTEYGRDLRKSRLDTEVELDWCERYASSHVVVGVHGSNMLIPSGLAGAVVELMPRDRWRNILEDLLFTPQDLREAMFRFRIVPVSVSAKEVAAIVVSLVTGERFTCLSMGREFCDHSDLGQMTERPMIWQGKRRVRESLP